MVRRVKGQGGGLSKNERIVIDLLGLRFSVIEKRANLKK